LHIYMYQYYEIKIGKPTNLERLTE
jgi:hypothetical protein